MTITSAEVEAIVRVVLRRLAGGNLSSPKPGASDATSHGGDGTLPASTLVLDERLITLDSLKGKLADKTSLQVPHNAVLTPAVLDELRGHGVELQKVNFAPAPNTWPGGPDSRLLVVAGGSLHAALGTLGEFTACSKNSPADVRRIAAHLNSGGKAAIWNTTTPFAAIRAAASNSSLQAVQLHRLEDWQRAVSQADPNVVIIDQESWKANQLQKLALLMLRRLK